MVLKPNHAWQHRRRRRNADGPENEGVQDNERHDDKTTEKDSPHCNAIFVRMTMPQFTTIFMKAYHVALEDGFTEKEAEKFAMFIVNQYVLMYAEDHLAQKDKKKGETKKAENKAKEEDHE
ncbi:MAG: hypothetical protein IKZ46_05145 [Victivallales bacterium]|nr:hypothetical protein [Victivallales bacterium]